MKTKLGRKPIRDHLIVKSNGLVEARFRLSPIEQKFLLKIISLIKPDDDDLKMYRIYVKDISEELGLDITNAYRQTKEVANALLSKLIVFPNVETGNTVVSGWLASAEYTDDEGFVEVEFSQKLKPHLLKMKKEFTAYSFKTVVQFSHSYSFRFYELCKQYESLGERVVNVEELRKMLCLEEKEYDRFYDFEKRIIEPSIKEINQRTEISISYEKIKKGKSIEKLKFLIEQKSDPEIFETQLDDEQKKVLRQGLRIGIRKNTLLGQLKAKSVNRVMDAVNIVSNAKDVTSPDAYFLKAITQGWSKRAEQTSF